jgi:alpha-ketoglutaric semialdehyde dehydrogenase
MAYEFTGASIIAGQPGDAGPHTFYGVNPRTRTRIDRPFLEATAEEVNRAVEAAVNAYEETRDYPAARLAAFLANVADEIEALGDQLIEVADLETGLGVPRLTGERQRATGQLRKFGDLLREGSYVEAVIDTAQPASRPSIRRMLFPLGPVAVFSASNFPFAFAVAGGDTASAFAAGCPVVVKGHPSHPATSELFAAAVNRAITNSGLPPGFFSLLQAEAIEAGLALVRHPGIAAVGFTGSLRAGRALFDAASARPVPIPVYAEMGSINPVVLLPGAVAERADALSEGLLQSVTLGSGQYCTNPGLIFAVNDPDTQDFISAFVEKMRQARPGVLLNGKIESGLQEAVNTTSQNQDVVVLIGGDGATESFFCYPHTVMQVSSEDFRADPGLQREHFGPVTLFVLCDALEDMLAAIDTLHGTLTGTVHAGRSEGEAANLVFNRLKEKCGRLIWDGFPTGVEVVHAMQHGGPYPATTAPATTSVGLMAIKRFMRPVAYQNMPDDLLPEALRDANPLGIWRIVDDEWTRQPISARR